MDHCQLRLKSCDKLNITICNALEVNEWVTPELTMVEIRENFLLSRQGPTKHELQTV
jgi:hypothetical protein